MKIKFHLEKYVEPGKAHYQHAVLVVAEGLKELGVEFYGNIDYWFEPELNEYVIKKADDDFEEDINIYSCWHVIRSPEVIKEVNYDKINILIDQQDGWVTPAQHPDFKDFDLILKCHCSKRFEKFTEKMEWATDYYTNYPDNLRPWNFGLSNRIIRMIDKYRHLEPKNQALVNFRMPYDVRSMSVEQISPIISKKYTIYNNITDPMSLLTTDDPLSYWAQSGRRHNEVYFKDINESKITYAFCGRVIDYPINKSLPSRTDRLIKRVNAKVANLLNLPPQENKYLLIIQYGGWRLFESFISNTLPLQMDFEYWGMWWPEMPVHGEHYWSVKGFRFKECAYEILNMPEEQRKEIAENGRAWALKYYSPKPVAQRMINYIKDVANIPFSQSLFEKTDELG